MSIAPSFPPLMQGRYAAGHPPFDAACAAASEGCDGGLILFDPGPDHLHAAMVFAPEVPLRDAMAMLPLCGVALQNALGALGPAEMAVHLAWSGDVLVNGAVAGRLRAAASTSDPTAVPEWLVVGFALRFAPQGEGGETPGRTALYAEGCGGLVPEAVLESWARHALAHIHTWEEGGPSDLHREYSGLLYGTGDRLTIAGQTGICLGLDEHLGLLLKRESDTCLVPLSHLLEERA